jgi:hypothetical protein
MSSLETSVPYELKAGLVILRQRFPEYPHRAGSESIEVPRIHPACTTDQLAWRPRLGRRNTMADEPPSPAPTWQPPPDFEQFGGDLDAAERRGLPDSAFAFPRQRKEPLSSASHVRSALSRFDQVTGVSDAERALAFENIRLAASYFDVAMAEKSWHDLRPPRGSH